MSYMIRTIQLTKVFNNKEVVSNVNMNVKQGEIYGFLGPNGAGKTTVMKMITSLIKPTTGEIELFGQKLTPKSYLQLGRMGSIIEVPVFYDKLSARENLDLHCKYMGYHNKKAMQDALELVNLQHIGDQSVREFSLGMKQRLGIARAIITKPEILILDEPINGLDPVGIKEIRDLFKMLSKEYGITLLVSSHMLGEVEQMVDTIGVINHGKLIQEVSMEEVKEKNMDYIEITVRDSKAAAFVLSNQLNLSNFKVINEHILRVYETRIPQNELNKILVMHDVEIESIYSKNSSLEDYFLSLLNGGQPHA
ncbi:ABC-2 type transport system ATP-binding protein [Paenibacillus turicensis]|uniref:ABC-2 type transport system ATP-binding protein n=1 Tax=Paenibacillus turicensis TaxID=160487 RepID=A0ABS4FS60_9BACL|nr:ABC transporter ATP-binding protein [Paenibacillus turicensis]MBP1905422.1 ABC-2 type transport system ATP-binding protein [Paenibacillus turicensis]